MTSELRVTTLSNATGDGPATLTQQAATKALAQYLGQTNILQSGSLNHASITDNGTGLFNHNFTNNFSNNDYMVIGASQRAATTSTIHNYTLQDGAFPGTERTTSVAQMDSHYVNDTTSRTNFDFDVNDFTAYGDLA